MAGFVYYVPGAKAVNRAKLEELGFGYAFDSQGGPASTPTSKGPDGGPGVLFTLPEPEQGGRADMRRSFKFEWTKHPLKDFWCAVDPKAKPKPEDLERANQLDGHIVELSDGQRWLIPVARAVDGSTPLPTRAAWNGNGWAPGDVIQRYRMLWEQACRIWDTIVGEAEEARRVVTFSEEMGIASHAIEANYRVSPWEVTVLGLLDSQSEQRVIKALVDWPALEELKKKLEREERSTELGKKAS